jgi:hypothetical protein
MDTSYYRTLTMLFGACVLLERYSLYYKYNVSSLEYTRKHNTNIGSYLCVLRVVA